MTTSASRPMRSNNAATAALRAGTNSAQSSAQSKTFLALLRREMAGHCHGVVATTTASGRSDARKILLRSTVSAICGAGSSIRRNQRRALDDLEGACISAMLSAAAGELPSPRPDAQLTQPAHVVRLLDERHAVPVLRGCRGERMLASDCRNPGALRAKNEVLLQAAPSLCFRRCRFDTAVCPGGVLLSCARARSAPWRARRRSGAGARRRAFSGRGRRSSERMMFAST